MASFSRKKNVNIFRVVSKLVGTLIALWAGGVIVTELGSVMLNTNSPFYKGLSLIGWTVGATTNASTASCATDSYGAGYGATAGPSFSNCITATSGSGILAVVGIIGIATIVLEFVDIRL